LNRILERKLQKFRNQN